MNVSAMKASTKIIVLASLLILALGSALSSNPGAAIFFIVVTACVLCIFIYTGYRYFSCADMTVTERREALKPRRDKAAAYYFIDAEYHLLNTVLMGIVLEINDDKDVSKVVKRWKRSLGGGPMPSLIRFALFCVSMATCVSRLVIKPLTATTLRYRFIDDTQSLK